MVKWQIMRELADKSTEYLYDSDRYGNAKQSHVNREMLIENTVMMCCELMEKRLSVSEIKQYFGITNE